MPETPTPIETRPMTAEDINEAIVLRAGIEAEISPESKQRAENLVGGAVRAIQEKTSLHPGHPFWKGRWEEIRYPEKVATILQVALPPMEQAAASYGREFFSSEIIDLVFQHAVTAGIVEQVKREGISTAGLELPSDLPGLSQNAPRDYLRSIRVLGRMITPVTSLIADIQHGHEEKKFFLREYLEPGELGDDKTRHQGFVPTLGNALHQLEGLRAGS